MFKLIDLSHPINDQMPSYPGDSPTQLSKTKKFEIDGFTNFQLNTNMHSGTHLDGPMHLTGQTKFISELPPETFYGAGCLLDVRGERIIGIKENYPAKIRDHCIVLFFTGFDQKYGTDEYYSGHPEIHPELADLLIAKHTKIIGLDFPSPDLPPYRVHKQLLAKNVLVLENLTNLNSLLEADQFEVMAFPLKIEADSSPLRVIARIQTKIHRLEKIDPRLF